MQFLSLHYEWYGIQLNLITLVWIWRPWDQSFYFKLGGLSQKVVDFCYNLKMRIRNSMRFVFYFRNEFDFWNVHGIMNTSGLLQSQ